MRRIMTAALTLVAVSAAALGVCGRATAQTRELDTRGVMLDRIATRTARVSPVQRDHGRDNGAEQRQKDDSLDHYCANPSSD